MPRPRSLAGELVLDYLNRFPDSPDKTLARKIYKENPSMFKSLETCHLSVRGYRGHIGKKMREKVKETTHFKPLRKSGDNSYNLPESHAETYSPFLLQQSKILNLSDIHIPYHDNKALEVAIEYGIKRDTNTILIKGDLIDFHNQSRFQKDPRMRSTFQEFEAARQFLKVLRDTFKGARIIFKEGNHDERWENWLYLKAPEIFDDPEFTLEARLKLGELKIEIIKDKIPVKVGNLWLLHGHELQGSGGANPARATFLKTISSVHIGHCHRTSSNTEPTLDGHVIVTSSQGCLCGMFPRFARVNKWNQGFSFIEHEIKTGEYELENLRIVNGKAYR